MCENVHDVNITCKVSVHASADAQLSAWQGLPQLHTNASNLRFGARRALLQENTERVFVRAREISAGIVGTSILLVLVGLGAGRRWGEQLCRGMRGRCVAPWRGPAMKIK